jgi:hypothetical protein
MHIYAKRIYTGHGKFIDIQGLKYFNKININLK